MSSTVLAYLRAIQRAERYNFGPEAAVLDGGCTLTVAKEYVALGFGPGRL